MIRPIWSKLWSGLWLAMIITGFITGKAHAKSDQPPPKLNGVLRDLLAAAPDFEARLYEAPDGRALRYRFMEPQANNNRELYPLVLFLSGTNERGADNIRQLKFAGPFFNKPDNRQNYPCFVVIPQCPLNQNWVYKEVYFGTVPLAAEPMEPLQLTLDLINYLERHLNIDSKRIYLMGVSSGASGVWDLAARYPERFAAAVPFAGSGDARQAQRLARLPIWIFHGAMDLLVNPECSRLMCNALQQAGGNPRYTEYALTSHTCWVKAFKDPELLHWLFAQHRQ